MLPFYITRQTILRLWKSAFSNKIREFCIWFKIWIASCYSLLLNWGELPNLVLLPVDDLIRVGAAPLCQHRGHKVSVSNCVCMHIHFINYTSVSVCQCQSYESTLKRVNIGIHTLIASAPFFSPDDLLPSRHQPMLSPFQLCMFELTNLNKLSLLICSTIFSVQGYSVVLPEKLQTGKWNVYR